MARSDLLITLLRAGSTGNASLFRKAAEALIAEERSRNHSVLADQLAAELERRPSLPNNGAGAASALIPASELFTERVPTKRLSDLVLDDFVSAQVVEVIE